MTDKLSLTALVRKFPIEQYLRSKGVDFVDKARYFSLKYCINPACRREQKLIINKDSKYFRCFVCDYKGSLINFISLLSEIDWRTAVDVVRNQTIFTASRQLTGLAEVVSVRSMDEAVLSELKEVSMPIYFNRIDLRDSSSDGANYLSKQRGYTQELVDLFDLRYHEYAKRVIFPIKDHLGRLVGWQGRDVTGGSDIKILTKPLGLKKSLLLYGFNAVKYESMMTVVEGPVDSHKSYQANSVALLGKQISSFQLSLLTTSPNLKVINLGLDPDARRECLELASELSLLYKVNIINLPTGKDLGDCSIDSANQAVSEAVSYEDYQETLSSSLRHGYY